MKGLQKMWPVQITHTLPPPLKSQMAYSYDSLISLVVHLMNHLIFFCTAVHFTHIFFAEDFLQSYEPIFLDTFIPLV